MADVHVPKLEDEQRAEDSPVSIASRGKSLSKIGLEVLLIGLGVFLGLMGEQWREHRHQDKLAEETLRRFHAEIAANRSAVEAVKEYHVTLKKGMEEYIRATDKRTVQVRIKGLQPVNFEHTAWDLALVTQSLAHIEPDVAFALSRIYTTQQTYAAETQGVMQALYMRPPNEDVDGFMKTAVIYYGDIVLFEPRLVAMYDEVLQKIEHALGEKPAKSD